MSKKSIGFTCYRSRCRINNKNKHSLGHDTIFLFYPNGQWDEYKLTLGEAIVKYPPTAYTWIKFEEEIDELYELFNALRKKDISQDYFILKEKSNDH